MAKTLLQTNPSHWHHVNNQTTTKPEKARQQRTAPQRKIVPHCELCDSIFQAKDSQADVVTPNLKKACRRQILSSFRHMRPKNPKI
jgi:hypothetical protein